MNRRGEYGSPKSANAQHRMEEVLRRKAEAERKVAERREALRNEQMNKLAKINELREAEKKERSRKQAEKELLRQKEALDRRQAQLEANEKKKEAILAKAHAASSRVANKENGRKSYAFGSSTPRELAYLDKLSKESKVYDTKIKQEGEISTLPPKPRRPLTNAMTTSFYTPQPRQPIRSAKREVSKEKNMLTASAPAVHNRSMTQSLYVPSLQHGGTVHSTRGIQMTPSRPPTTKKEPPKRRMVMSERKPPVPRPMTKTVDEVKEEEVETVNVPPILSEDSDAGFSEGSFERGGSEKGTPVHSNTVKIVNEEIDERDDVHGKEIRDDELKEEENNEMTPIQDESPLTIQENSPLIKLENSMEVHGVISLADELGSAVITQKCMDDLIEPLNVVSASPVSSTHAEKDEEKLMSTMSEKNEVMNDKVMGLNLETEEKDVANQVEESISRSSSPIDHPSNNGAPSTSSSQSGDSPLTRRRILDEKKAEMMKQSTILAMADSAAKERDERKARLAAIMNRTRGGSSSQLTSSTPLTPHSQSSSVLAKIAHITSNPSILRVAEKTNSGGDLSRMEDLPGAVPTISPNNRDGVLFH